MERTSQQWSFLSLSANVTFVQTDFSDVTRAVSGAGRRGRRMGLPPARALLPTEHTAAAQGGGAVANDTLHPHPPCACGQTPAAEVASSTVCSLQRSRGLYT